MNGKAMPDFRYKKGATFPNKSGPNTHIRALTQTHQASRHQLEITCETCASRNHMGVSLSFQATKHWITRCFDTHILPQ
jgi:hypothetical protein